MAVDDSLQCYCGTCKRLVLIRKPIGERSWRCTICNQPTSFHSSASSSPVGATKSRKSAAILAAENPIGGVYLVKMGAHYKIGKANDFGRRFKQVNLELPEKAVEIHRIYTDDPRGIESYWHRRFKDKRANGEWFNLTDEDVAVFKARDKM